MTPATYSRGGRGVKHQLHDRRFIDGPFAGCDDRARRVCSENG